MYKVDPDNDKKQVPKQLAFHNPSFIQTFATDAAAQVANPAKGVMTFSSAGDGDLFVYDGTNWRKVAFSAV